MREYLFKGKRLDNGEWVEGGYRHEKVGEYVTVVFVIEPLTSGVWESHRVDPETVGQYTGLPDKNGRKIFEGDIVRAELIGGAYRGYSWGNQKVVFDRGAFCVEDRRGDTMPLRSYAPSVEIEVIGNVFDTPELLEAKE